MSMPDCTQKSSGKGSLYGVNNLITEIKMLQDVAMRNHTAEKLN